MGMGEEQKSGHVDVRVITLYSQDTEAVPLRAAPHQHEMLEYFNVMDIRAFNGREPLLNAYRVSRGNCAEHGFSDPKSAGPVPQEHSSAQILLAFTDITETSDGTGFTQKEIADFWKDVSKPLLFVTLLNLKDTEQISRVVNRIREKYAGEEYLIYFTLDYCEAVIFLKCSTFRRCAELVFSLDYGLEDASQSAETEKPGEVDADNRQTLLANSLTLYSLVSEFNFDAQGFQPEEKFGVYLRLGMSDAKRVQDFCDKLKKETRETFESYKYELSEKWILGRYDIGFFHPEANLRWIVLASKLLQQADSVQEDEGSRLPWYKFHTFSILIPPPAENLQGRIAFHNSDNRALGKRMKRASARFADAYKMSCGRLNILPDEVFIRWVDRASAQAVSFCGSNMMSDLGICLVSQFLDFFAYAQRLWSAEHLTNRQREQAEACFSTFFSNILILVDGMNHTSRQFILTPPFRTIAFEIPPKVMAYYTAVTHRLIEAFDDSEGDEQYGFIISPKFARELDVRSLVLAENAGENEFISIGIGEEWLYRLQHTTAVLAHEISHFVGGKGRERAFRKRCVLMAETQTVLLELCSELHHRLVTHYSEVAERLQAKLPEAFPKPGAVYISMKALEREAEKLLEILYECDESCRNENSYVYMRDLAILMRKVPYHFHDNLLLQDELFNFFWRVLISDEEGITNIGRTIAWTEAYYVGTIRSEEKPHAAPDFQAILDGFSRYHIRSLFQEILKEYAGRYVLPSSDQTSWIRQTRELFSETYADLQAILLLNLHWVDYCRLFSHLKETLPDTVRPRLLAMRILLFADEPAMPDFKEEDFFLEEIRKIENLAVSLRLLSPDEEDKDLERWYRLLQEENIDPSAFRYLEEYLARCRFSVEAHFEKCNDRKDILVDIYRNLEDGNGAYKLFDHIMKFIASYRKDIQRVTQDTLQN